MRRKPGKVYLIVASLEVFHERINKAQKRLLVSATICSVLNLQSYQSDSFGLIVKYFNNMFKSLVWSLDCGIFLHF